MAVAVVAALPPHPASPTTASSPASAAAAASDDRGPTHDSSGTKCHVCSIIVGGSCLGFVRQLRDAGRWSELNLSVPVQYRI